jgi:glycyl-tRNA synthetase (class II)
MLVEPSACPRWIFKEHAVENSCERYFHDQSELVHYANKCIDRFTFVQGNEGLAVLHCLE